MWLDRWKNMKHREFKKLVKIKEYWQNLNPSWPDATGMWDTKGFPNSWTLSSKSSTPQRRWIFTFMSIQMTPRHLHFRSQGNFTTEPHPHHHHFYFETGSKLCRLALELGILLPQSPVRIAGTSHTWILSPLTPLANKVFNTCLLNYLNNNVGEYITAAKLGSEFS